MLNLTTAVFARHSFPTAPVDESVDATEPFCDTVGIALATVLTTPIDPLQDNSRPAETRLVATRNVRSGR